MRKLPKIGTGLGCIAGWLAFSVAQAVAPSAGRGGCAPRLSSPKVWCLYSGKTLRQSLSIWAQRAGWQLQWSFQHDYPIVAGACFRGDFYQAIQTVTHSYSQAEHPFYLDLYPRQRLAVISD